MTDQGWVGQFVHSLWRYDRSFAAGPQSIQETEPCPDPRPLLYDAAGRPLTRDRRAGFVVTDRR